MCLIMNTIPLILRLPFSCFLKVLFREWKHVGALTDTDLQNYYGATAISHFHVYTNFSIVNSLAFINITTTINNCQETWKK